MFRENNNKHTRKHIKRYTITCWPISHLSIILIFSIEEIIVSIRGSSLTQMREGLWRCSERLGYALAVESGMCSGTEKVFSTGLWWISVHLDNRVVRSLGWHSTSAGHQLSQRSWSLVFLLTFTDKCNGIWTVYYIWSFLALKDLKTWLAYQTVFYFLSSSSLNGTCQIKQWPLCSVVGQLIAVGFGAGWGGSPFCVSSRLGYAHAHRATAVVHLVEALIITPSPFRTSTRAHTHRYRHKLMHFSNTKHIELELTVAHSQTFLFTIFILVSLKISYSLTHWNATCHL